MSTPEAAAEDASIGYAFLSLCALMVAYGLSKVATKFVEALFGVAGGILGHIPWIGGITTGPLHSIEQRLTNALGDASASFDAGAASYFHSLASQVEAMAANIRNNGAGFLALAKWAAHHIAGQSIEEQLRNERAKVAHAQAVAQAAAQSVSVAKGLAQENHPPAYVYKAGAIAAELPGVIGRDIPNLRDQVQAAERSISDLWKRVKGKTISLGSLAFTGAAVWALTKVGAGWLRCSNWRKIGNAGCNLTQDALNALLLAFGVVVATEGLVKFAEEEKAVLVGFEDAARTFWHADTPGPGGDRALGAASSDG